MISWFKKHFIPHEQNDHRPHILRSKNIRNIVFAILILEVFAFLLPTLIKINRNGGMASVLPAILSDLTNEERQSQKIEPLKINPILNKAAQLKASDMAKERYFSHVSPSGKTPWYWLKEVGYDYKYAGENLAINFVDSSDVTKAWMNSPTHKSNIIKENYTEIGTGVATGMYEGKETIFVAQIYANPNIENIQDKATTIEVNNGDKTENIKTLEVNVLGVETENVQATQQNPIIQIENIQKEELNKPSLLNKIFASPRRTINFILFVILGVIFISLILNTFIKRKHYHEDLVTNGLVVVALIGAILLSNYLLTHRNMKIMERFDYSKESTQ